MFICTTKERSKASVAAELGYKLNNCKLSFKIKTFCTYTSKTNIYLLKPCIHTLFEEWFKHFNKVLGISG